MFIEGRKNLKATKINKHKNLRTLEDKELRTEWRNNVHICKAFVITIKESWTPLLNFNICEKDVWAVSTWSICIVFTLPDVWPVSYALTELGQKKKILKGRKSKRWGQWTLSSQHCHGEHPRKYLPRQKTVWYASVFSTGEQMLRTSRMSKKWCKRTKFSTRETNFGYFPH